MLSLFVIMEIIYTQRNGILFLAKLSKIWLHWKNPFISLTNLNSMWQNNKRKMFIAIIFRWIFHGTDIYFSLFNLAPNNVQVHNLTIVNLNWNSTAKLMYTEKGAQRLFIHISCPEGLKVYFSSDIIPDTRKVILMNIYINI